MAATTKVMPAGRTFETVEDLLERLGGIAPARVRIRPPIGTATETDLIEANAKKAAIFELIDGVLVEKATGYPESFLALFLGGLLNTFVIPRNLGIVSGADGMMRCSRVWSAGPTSPSSPGTASRAAGVPPARSPTSPPTWPSKS